MPHACARDAFLSFTEKDALFDEARAACSIGLSGAINISRAYGGARSRFRPKRPLNDWHAVR
jgi:hypothetical protein